MKKRIAYGLIGLLLLSALGYFVWASLSPSYLRILRANWGLDIPNHIGCTELYGQSTSSFHGDGPRFHVFQYQREEPIVQLVDWRSDQPPVIVQGISVQTIMDELEVPEQYRPTDLESCPWWYQSKIKNTNHLWLLLDDQEDRLYVAEFFT